MARRRRRERELRRDSIALHTNFAALTDLQARRLRGQPRVLVSQGRLGTQQRVPLRRQRVQLHLGTTKARVGWSNDTVEPQRLGLPHWMDLQGARGAHAP